jgi:PAS domain S-box-containing protein
MLKVIYLCVTHQHDIRFVFLAGFICVFDCLTGINLFVRAREANGRRQFFLLSGAACVFSTGVWATHFVAELAFKPGLPVAYDNDLTALSLGVAMLLVWLGMGIALRFDRPVAGGALIGAAIGAMHYIGMAAMRVPAYLHWNWIYVAASVAIGMTGAALAMRVVCLGLAWRYRVWAAAFLVAAICGLHFTGMAAITLTTDALVAMPADVMAPEQLALLVAASTIGIVMLGMSASLADEQSARRATREAEILRRSEEHLARAQRIAGVGSMEVDARTGHVEWSAEACTIFGVDPDRVEPTYKYLLSFVHPDDRAAVEVAAEKSIATGQASPPLEARIVRPDGTVRMVYCESDLVMDGAGRVVCPVLTLRDVTELRAAEQRRRELEAELRHSQKLEALGTLAGGIAHDLNNTLVPVLTLSQLLMAGIAEEDREDLETIIFATRRAKALVQQILAFSRKQEIQKTQIDPMAVVRQALQMLRATLPPNIAVIEEIDAVPPILADAGQLQQVVVNLVTNAAQAIGGDNASITVGVSALGPASGAGRHGDTVQIRIADTGCGMEKEVLDRVFEPFFTTKGVGEGTGLGLSVVHGIITGHGGNIEVSSEPGKGTVFTIMLPAAQPASRGVESVAA